MLDRVGHTGILGHGFVREVNLAVLVQGYIFQKGVALDRVVDIRLGILVQVDDLRVAAALVVEDAVVIPSVLIIADQQSLGIRGKGGLAGAGEAKEDRRILAFHIGVGRAVHRSDALQRHIIVHHGEHALLHLAAVPGVDDNLLMARDVEGNRGLGIEAQLLVVLYLCLGSVVDNEGRLEVLLLLSGRADEHVADEMRLPGNFHDEADSHPRILIRPAERVYHVELLAGKFLLRDGLELAPGLLACRMVIILVLIGCPPNGVLGILIHDDVFVLGGTTGKFSGHDIDGTKLADLALLIPGKTRLCLLLEQLFIGRIIDNFRSAGNSVLC